MNIAKGMAKVNWEAVSEAGSWDLLTDIIKEREIKRMDAALAWLEDNVSATKRMTLAFKLESPMYADDSQIARGIKAAIRAMREKGR